MLTSVYRQVNANAMVAAQTDHHSGQTAQQTLLKQLLQPLLARRRPERILVLKQAGASDPPLDLVSPALIVRINSEQSSMGGPLRCRLDALPFEEAVFDLIIVHHLLRDGCEEFFDETLRVLVAGGDLVISGLNSSGLRNLVENRKNTVAALKLNRVFKFLRAHSFKIEDCLLMGLAGLPWPVTRSSSYGIGLPFADRAVIHGHHQSNIKNASILKFRNSRSARVASAALDGVSSRESAL